MIGVQQFWPVMDDAVKPGRVGSTRANNIFFSFLLLLENTLDSNMFGAEASFGDIFFLHPFLPRQRGGRFGW